MLAPHAWLTLLAPLALLALLAPLAPLAPPYRGQSCEMG